MNIQKLIVIAAYLEGWRLDTRNPHRPCFINGQGLSINILPEKNQRFKFSGIAPSDLHGRCYGFNYWLGRDTEHPQITVSRNREAAHIARDIQQRLIPNYARLFNEASTAIKRNAENLKWCDNIEGLFTNLLKGQPPYNGRTQQKKELTRRICFGTYKAPSGSGEVVLSTYSGGEVNINIGHLTPDLAIKLMHFYQNEIVKHDH